MGTDHLEEEYDFGEHVKEVYARFGLAFYHANVLEHELVNLAALVELQQNTPSSREFVEALFEGRFKKVFGQLVREVKALAVFPSELETSLSQALERRNYLAHHYFRERAGELCTHEGRDYMIQELSQMTHLFSDVDSQLSNVSRQIANSLGVTDSMRTKALQERIEAAQNRAFHGMRSS